MPAPLTGLRALVSGGGVAGPALAYWLARYGADTTVVELAPAPRTGGFAVDFRGPTHLGVLETMGVLDELRAIQTHGGAMSWVDEHDREIFRLPEAFAGGDIEVRRRDLGRVLYEAAADRVDYRFSDTVTALAETADGVHVDFARSASGVYDLVVGADGLHSKVRALAYGPERDYVHHLDYYLAGWDLPNEFGASAVPRLYNVPGRMASVSAPVADGPATAMAVFASPRIDHDWHDTERQRRIVTEAFTGLGWHVPALLEGLREAPELYFDAICRVAVPKWTTRRTALLGDAAWGVTLGGMGVGTGVVGAYVLAGELAAAGGDTAPALAAYERRMRPYAGRWQRGANPGKFLAPATRRGLWLRDAMFKRAMVRNMLVASTGSLAEDAGLPDYPALVAA
jgi:2-polyprenyl-6-methoxyphenol hydroxylase-like FAD-dependent oxidoreductase